MNPVAIRQQIDALLLAHPELAEDDVLRADMLEGETDLHEFLQMLILRRKETVSAIEGNAKIITAFITPIQERNARLEQRERVIRKVILAVMEAAGLRKIELPLATISTRAAGERLVINDDALVPQELCRVKHTYTPDKARILAQLKNGASFNWAALVPGEPGVTIRET
jgi:hypothetical protein